MIYNIIANPLNVGDYVTHLGIRHLLGRDIQPLFCDLNYLDELKATIRKSSQDDSFLVGGGGLLCAYFDTFWSILASEQPRTFIWGIGVCDVKTTNTQPNWKVVERVLANAKLVSFRDPYSSKHIGGLFSTECITGCPSIGWLQNLPNTCTAKHVLQVDHPELYASYHKVHGGNSKEFMSDNARRLSGRLGVGSRAVDNVFPHGLDPTTAENFIRDAYMRSAAVLTSRFHGALIGLACGRPTAAWSNDFKIDALFEMLQLSDWVSDDPQEFSRITARIEDQPSCFESLSRLAVLSRDFAAKVESMMKYV